MANSDHLEIPDQGVIAWNEWRKKDIQIKPDLYGVDLSGKYFAGINVGSAILVRANLAGAVLGSFENRCNLSGARLISANMEKVKLENGYCGSSSFRGANLKEACLRNSDLEEADFAKAILSGADLTKADLRATNFSEADLSNAILEGAILYVVHDMERNAKTDPDIIPANLSYANLCGASLKEAELFYTDLFRANLKNTKLTSAIFSAVRLDDVDLSAVNDIRDLTSIRHSIPSSISIKTLINSSGKIPKEFLKGCGLSDWQIEVSKLHQPDLGNEETINILYRICELRTSQPIQIKPLFISYSHNDAIFVDKLEKLFDEESIRFWRDIHHAVAGGLETQIDQAIKLNPVLLLILSEHSVKCDWVQHEIRIARKWEIETERDVLCPIALDNSWKSVRWPERLREQIMEYNIYSVLNHGKKKRYSDRCRPDL